MLGAEQLIIVAYTRGECEVICRRCGEAGHEIMGHALSAYEVGDRVHVDADTEEWGRVASDATVVHLFYDEVQLEVDSIRATLTVYTREVEPITPSE